MLRGHRLRRHVPVEYVGQSTRMQAADWPWHLLPRRRQAYLNAGAGTDANRKRKKEEAGMRQEGSSPRRAVRPPWLDFSQSQTRIVGGTAAWVPVSRRCSILLRARAVARVGATRPRLGSCAYRRLVRRFVSADHVVRGGLVVRPNVRRSKSNLR
jgi:hypothetical protein